MRGLWGNELVRIALGVLSILNVPLLVGLPFAIIFAVIGLLTNGSISLGQILNSLWIGYSLFATAGGMFFVFVTLLNSGRIIGFLIGRDHKNRMWSKDIGEFPIWIAPMVLVLSYYGHCYLKIVTTGELSSVMSPIEYTNFYFGIVLDVISSDPDN